MNYIPKHRDDSRPVDAPSRALILPPVHTLSDAGQRCAIVGGRHRDYGRNAGTIVEEILSAHPRSERGSAQWSAVLILSMFAAFLFALTTVTR